ncbi:hypothetical protein MKW94_008437 [Papaver nudicaule]|uniref:Uncharacterized protein n=1 Tax=Papaver nudicaule TaxID=74823 RepID=A0AA41VT19_PAPNU|nr:hypothetical protein [Papaver nudicaule]
MANMMGLSMLLVVVMALYVGKAQGATGICAYDCTREKHVSGFWNNVGAAIQCGGECLHYSSMSGGEPEGVQPASPQLLKALELLAQAPEVQQGQFDISSLGRKALPPSLSNLPMIKVEDRQ